MRYDIEYGRKILRLDVPDERVVDVLAPRKVRAIPDIGAAVRVSLERPFESPPLAELLRFLTQGERDAVYEAVINLVEARLSKARNFKRRR